MGREMGSAQRQILLVDESKKIGAHGRVAAPILTSIAYCSIFFLQTSTNCPFSPMFF
jgi:hypothetical protein